MFRQRSDQWPTWQDFANKKNKCMDTLQRDWWMQNKTPIWFPLASLALIFNSIFFTPAFSFIEGKLVQNTVSASGFLQSTVYNLNFQVSGPTISEIDVKQGQSVVAGQVLARLNTTAFQDALNVEQANVNVARSNLTSALAQEGVTGAAAEAVIAAAEAQLSVAQVNKRAINKQSSAIVENAETVLESDQNTLNHTINFANAQIAAATAQWQQSLLNCKSLITPTTSISASVSTSATRSLSASISASGPIATPLPTATTSVSASVSTSNTSDLSKSASLTKTSSLTISPANSYSDCVAVANTTYNQAVRVANLSVASAQATVEQDETALDLAHADARVNNKEARGNVKIAYYGVGVANTSANANITSAQSNVTAAQGQLELAIANLTQAQHSLANTTLVAPHAGVITAINGTVGSVPNYPTNIVAGNSAGYGPFIRLVDLSSVGQIQVSVGEVDILKVKVGQPVQFTVKAYGSRQFKGTVSAISPEGISNSSGISYPVIIAIDPKSVDHAELLPNMTANATISV
jgi:multidrug resistance efflux pump